MRSCLTYGRILSGRTTGGSHTVDSQQRVGLEQEEEVCSPSYADHGVEKAIWSNLRVIHGTSELFIHGPAGRQTESTQLKPSLPVGSKKKLREPVLPAALDPVVRISSSKVRSVAMEWRLGATGARFFGRPQIAVDDLGDSVMGSEPCRVFSATQWGREGARWVLGIESHLSHDVHRLCTADPGEKCL